MPGLSKVIVLDPDVRAARQIQLGFRREGIPAVAVEVPRDLAELPPPAPDAGLWIVGGAAPGALGLVRRARRLLELADIDAPIVFAGRGVDRLEAEDAGADEVLLQPAYLRDVVTVGRLLYGQPVARRGHLVGNLADTTTVLSLVRAFAAVGRSAVLTLIRGLRRGEVRFYHGEVTSAQVGLLNGQAALHQLLLWTDARFDYRYEDIVRRQQIPLDRDELYADAERFLEGVRESSGRLSPAMVLEQDVPRLTSLGKQIPLEVFSVLRMFDGHRVLADVLEDSPYRVFETLRVAQLALEAGLLRQATKQRPRATWRAVLALEEWLVGVPPQDEGPATAVAPAAPAAPVPEAVSDSAPIPRPVVDSNSGPAGAAAGRGDKSGPVGRGDKSGPLGRGDKSGPLRMKGSRRKRKKWRTTPAAGTPTSAAAAPSSKLRAEIDWGALIPREVGAEVGTLAGVVPAAQAAGEITLPAREKLEELTSAAQRERLFSVEMTVFFDDGEVPEAAAPRAVPEAAVPRVVLEVVAPQAVPEAVAPQAVSEAVAPQTVSEVAALLMVPGLMAGLTEAHETTRIRSPFAIAKANAAAAAAPTPPAAAVAAPAPVAMAAAQEAPAQEAPAVDIPAPVAAEPPSPAAPVAVEPPSPAAPVAAEPPSPTAPAAAIPEPESGVAPPPEPTVTPTPTVATPSESATATAALKFNAPPPAVETPEERARRDAEETAALEEMYRAEAEAAARAQAAAAAPSTATAQAEPATTPVVEPTAAQAAPAAAQPQMPPTVEPPTVELPTVELPATDPAAAAAASAEPAAASAEPAAASAEPPRAPQNEPPIPNLATESPDPDSEYPSMLIDVSSGAPAIELLDETSDGIIRQMLATAETAPTPRRPLYEIPVDDRPEDTTGEIVTKTGQRAAMQPQLDTEPSILVADLAEMHTAGSAQTAAPTPVAARTAAEGSAPAAKVFSETEEDFFRAGQAKRPTAPPETFADLDEGYKPVGFWARLLGRKRKR